MKLVLVGDSQNCSIHKFEIDDKIASSYDFGRWNDCSPEEGIPWGCGDMKFITEPPSPETLSKYNITEEEYAEVCEELRSSLSLGKCRFCRHTTPQWSKETRTTPQGETVLIKISSKEENW